MNITLSYNAKDAVPKAVKASRIKLSLHYQYTYTWAACVGILGIFFLVTGIPDSAISIGIGIALLYLSGFYAYQFLKARHKLINRYKKALSIENNDVKVILSLTDELFIYTDNLGHYEIKWKFFSGYFIRDSYLFLVSPTGILSAYAIYIDYFEKNDLDEFKEFLLVNVPVYKRRIQ